MRLVFIDYSPNGSALWEDIQAFAALRDQARTARKPAPRARGSVRSHAA